MASEELILIIEDEANVRQILDAVLRGDGFRTLLCADGKAGIEEAIRHQPDLILLDLNLPHADGYEVCRILRQTEATQRLPIIFLTGKGEKTDVAVGLGIGADDYIIKPFHPTELLARVSAALRRSRWSEDPKDKTRVSIGPLTLDSSKMEATIDNKSIPFTVGEFRILWLLGERPGVIFSREQILSRLSGGESEVSDRSVDVHINGIRKKLGAQMFLVETVRGVGYRLNFRPSEKA
jgi:DNA-binding response OmpR family regulator